MIRRDFTTLRYPFAKGRLFLTTSIGLALPVTVWGAVHFALKGDAGDTAVLAFVSLPLLGLDLWVWSRLLTNRAALVLGDGFLIDRASLFGTGRVEASAVSGVRVGPGGLWQGVIVEFKSGQGRLHRRSTSIPTVLLGESAEAIAADINQWREHAEHDESE